MKKLKYLFVIFILIAIDQIVKLIIHFNYLGADINIIGEYVKFYPKLNTDLSWVNSLLGGIFGFWFHIVINIIALFMIIIVFDYLRTKKKDTRVIRILFLFAIAGTICSLIDKIFWGGSLDFIGLKGLFVFDMKDCYLTFFEVGVIIVLMKNFHEFNNFKAKTLVRHVQEKVLLKYSTLKK